MDTETTEVIERLRGDIHQFEARSTLRFDALDARFDGLEGRIDGQDVRFDGLERRIDGQDVRFDGLDARIDGLEGRIEQLDARVKGLDARVEGLDARVDRLDQRQEQRFEETRRHFDVIAESLRDDIRMIAEGLVALSTKVDQAFRR